ncbi:MAG: AzlC family ABC transporter permease [Clostridia bacterium]|nr:AzlC family ABC transporter permease [Clostridia bacterium]
MSETKWAFRRGMRDGIPIALGYFAVSFALGITAHNAGLNALQATLASAFCNASAGEYAAFTVIAGGGTYWEMALMMLVANARYLLMSCALSQKLSPDTPLHHRLLIGFDVTDEIFGISVAAKPLVPSYIYGAMVLAIPGWAGGTCFGVLMGDLLPVRVVRALSVGLFGMFLAIIVPPARKNRVVAGLVAVSMLASWGASFVPHLSEGVRVILLTLLIAGAAAVLFPVREEGAE